jgi:hypothetical protein
LEEEGHPIVGVFGKGLGGGQPESPPQKETYEKEGCRSTPLPTPSSRDALGFVRMGRRFREGFRSGKGGLLAELMEIGCKELFLNKNPSRLRDLP